MTKQQDEARGNWRIYAITPFPFLGYYNNPEATAGYIPRGPPVDVGINSRRLLRDCYSNEEGERRDRVDPATFPRASSCCLRQPGWLPPNHMRPPHALGP